MRIARKTLAQNSRLTGWVDRHCYLRSNRAQDLVAHQFIIPERSHRIRPLPKSAQRSIARKGLLFHSLMRYLCTSWEAGRLLSSQRFRTVVVTLASSVHLLSSAARRSAQSPSISRFSCLVCRASERDFSPSHACDPRGVGTLLRSFRGDSLCF